VLRKMDLGRPLQKKAIISDAELLRGKPESCFLNAEFALSGRSSLFRSDWSVQGGRLLQILG